MHFVLLIYSDEARWVTMAQAEREQGMAAYDVYRSALEESGVMTGGNRLRTSPAATTVRVVNGNAEVFDGPHSDLGGYFVIDVPDLDAALAWAVRCPAASHGVVEVRPL